MALPPIITNSPLFKVLSGAQARPAKDTTEPAAKAPGDSVKLSDEALRKLENVEIQSQNKARSAAIEARADLEQNPNVTLGFDPAAEL